MAEGTEPEVLEANSTVAAVDMDVEKVEDNQKRAREEDESQEDKEDGVAKRQKAGEEEEKEKSVEEERLEQRKEEEEEEEEEDDDDDDDVEEKKSSGPINLGFKQFGSSLEIFNYFYHFLHVWPPYLNVNKYEHRMLLELLKNGHTEPDKKIGVGIRAFQVRKHPVWKSRCFFLIREDDSVDDFSFRKCVDHILPLPEEMQVKSDVNKALGGAGGGKRHGGKGGSGRGGGRGRGRGRGGKWRN